MATASKKADRIAAEGIVDSYIHMGGKIGVLIEVNCETDFVARSEQFVELVHTCVCRLPPQSPCMSERKMLKPKSLQRREKSFWLRLKTSLIPSLAAVIEKMVEGRINKYYKEVCLLETGLRQGQLQDGYRFDKRSRRRYRRKITVRRFVRYEMGEGLEKRQDNFAQEIQEQLESVKK